MRFWVAFLRGRELTGRRLRVVVLAREEVCRVAIIIRLYETLHGAEDSPMMKMIESLSPS